MQQVTTYGPPPRSVIAVAIVLFLGSLPCFFTSGNFLWQLGWLSADNRASLAVILGLPFLFSLVAIATSFGLLWRREWARKAGLGLATFPVCACVLFLILYHPYDLYSPPFAAMDVFRLIAEILLAILIPASIWWWFLLTRDSVRSLFRQDRQGRSDCC